MKLLIVTPDLRLLGGVSSHYKGLLPHWREDVKYLIYGRRQQDMPRWKVLLLYPYDFGRYVWQLLTHRYDIVVINPSLRRAQVIRDGVYLLTARLFRRRVVTFVHGFDCAYAKQLASRQGVFQWCYNQSTFLYVLCGKFKRQLQKAGITRPIFLTTTKVSDELVEDLPQYPRKQVRHILYLARVHKDKGIFELLSAFEMLKAHHTGLILKVAGDGPALSEAKRLVHERGLQGITFEGSVTGERLKYCYKWGDVYVLPTYEEGMATTVLEAMAFGLPVITRPVGGIVDFWQEGKMGYLISSLNPKDYAEKIEKLMADEDLTEHISQFNYTYSRRFLASEVARKMEEDIRTQILLGTN